jgi:hypothetical protein
MIIESTRHLKVIKKSLQLLISKTADDIESLTDKNTEEEVDQLNEDLELSNELLNAINEKL